MRALHLLAIAATMAGASAVSAQQPMETRPGPAPMTPPAPMTEPMGEARPPMTPGAMAPATGDAMAEPMSNAPMMDAPGGEPGQAAPAPEIPEERISIDFPPNTEIAIVLRNVSDLFELNLVLPETLQGTVSLKLRDVTWRQVFNVALANTDFTYVEDGNIIRVINRQDVTREPVFPEVVLLRFASANEIKGIIDPMLNAQAGERLQIGPRRVSLAAQPGQAPVAGESNALILTASRKRLEEIRTLINQLDNIRVDARQVVIDTKFIEATVNDVRNVGVNWASLNQYRLSAGPFGRTYESTFDRSRDNADTNSAGNTSGTTSSNTLTNGVTTTLPAGGTTPSTTSTSSQNTTLGSTSGLTQAIDRLVGVTDSATIGRATTAVFSASEFAVILSALETDNKVRLVSNPTVVSLTNEEAQINVSTRFPVILTTSTPSTGGAQISETREYEEFGIKLRVTPQIRPDNLLSLSITPEVSNLDGFNVAASGNRYPIVSRRTVTNRVNLKDGFTIALGGLVQTQTSRGGSKVPFLGDIPLLGRAFRSKEETESGRNLIVFITARIIDAAGDFREAATNENFDTLIGDMVDPRTLRSTGVSREDLPGFRPALTPFKTAEEIEAEEALKRSKRRSWFAPRQPKTANDEAQP